MQEDTGLSEVLYTRVPGDLKQEAQARADRMMVSLSDIVRLALVAYLRPEQSNEERDNGK